MGLIGEVFAKAGLNIDNGSFAQYAANLQSAEGQISNFAASSKAAMAGAFMAPAAAITGIAAYGVSLASNFQDAKTTLNTLYGDADIAKEKMQWMTDFSASTPFQFDEIVQGGIKLKAYGMDIEQYGRTFGDTAAGMGKTFNDVIEAVADAQTGEFERLKELGVKAVQVTKANLADYEQFGGKVGGTMLTYVNRNGEQMAQAVDRNNREMVTSTLSAIWNEKYAGAMETRSKTLSGMVSTLKDNLQMGLADLAGFDMGTMEVQGASLLGVLMKIIPVAISVAGAFTNMSEPMQMFVSVAALGVVGIGLLSAGFIAYSAILPLVTSGTAIFGFTLTAALWPATLIVGGIALLAAGLVYLDEKTGLVSKAWEVLKDIFTITVDVISRTVSALATWVTQKIEEVRTAIDNMIPDGWAEKIGGLLGIANTYFGNFASDTHTQAEKIRGSTETAGEAAKTTGTSFFNMANSAIPAITNTGNAAGGLTEKLGTVPGAVNDVTGATNSGKGALDSYSSSFTILGANAGTAAGEVEKAASRIGTAYRNFSGQVGGIESLAGKWNTRAKLGIEREGRGSGTGEGNVRIKDKGGLYGMPESEKNARKGAKGQLNVHVGTVNNYGESNSQNKNKLRIISKA